MDSELFSQGKYIQIDGQMTFPNPENEYLSEIEWKMRYDRKSVTEQEMLHVAEVISAYREIVCRKTQTNRNKVCAAIKRVCAQSN